MRLKKNYLGEMLIEQIIEFKLKGLGPLNRTCTPTTGYFHVKPGKVIDKCYRSIMLG